MDLKLSDVKSAIVENKYDIACELLMKHKIGEAYLNQAKDTEWKKSALFLVLDALPDDVGALNPLVGTNHFEPFWAHARIYMQVKQAGGGAAPAQPEQAGPPAPAKADGNAARGEKPADAKPSAQGEKPAPKSLLEKLEENTRETLTRLAAANAVLDQAKKENEEAKKEAAKFTPEVLQQISREATTARENLQKADKTVKSAEAEYEEAKNKAKTAADKVSPENIARIKTWGAPGGADLEHIDEYIRKLTNEKAEADTKQIKAQVALAEAKQKYSEENDKFKAVKAKADKAAQADGTALRKAQLDQKNAENAHTAAANKEKAAEARIIKKVRQYLDNDSPSAALWILKTRTNWLNGKDKDTLVNKLGQDAVDKLEDQLEEKFVTFDKAVRMTEEDLIKEAKSEVAAADARRQAEEARQANQAMWAMLISMMQQNQRFVMSLLGGMSGYGGMGTSLLGGYAPQRMPLAA